MLTTELIATTLHMHITCHVRCSINKRLWSSLTRRDIEYVIHSFLVKLTRKSQILSFTLQTDLLCSRILWEVNHYYMKLSLSKDHSKIYNDTTKELILKVLLRKIRHFDLDSYWNIYLTQQNHIQRETERVCWQG